MAIEVIEIGTVEAIYRYPVKSMRGESLQAATLGWHGLEGDRRHALRRIGERGGVPWLTANKLPELVLFTPRRRDGENGDALPTHVLTPGGEELEIHGSALATEVARRSGVPVEMVRLDHGVFDDAAISVITCDTVAEVCRLAGKGVLADVRRFRPNVLVRSTRAVPFEEDGWLGGTLRFGEGDDAPAVAVTLHDVRCVMVNIDPDDASLAPEVSKAAVRANENRAGVYGTVTRRGRLAVGQRVVLHR